MYGTQNSDVGGAAKPVRDFYLLLQPETYTNTGKLTGSYSECLQLWGNFSPSFSSHCALGEATHSALSPDSSLEGSWPIKGGLQEQQGTLGHGVLNTGCLIEIHIGRTTHPRKHCYRGGILPPEASWEKAELPRGVGKTGRWRRVGA